MKLDILYETVGHWRTFPSPYHVDPKMRKKDGKKDLSFRIKEPRGGIDDISKDEALKEIEDVAYGLSKKYELRPTQRRVQAVLKLMETDDNPILKEIYEIWSSNHGVLPKEHRINGLKEYLTPEGGEDRTQRCETGARPIPSPGKVREIGMKI